METLDKIIVDINNFDIECISSENISDIFKRLDKIISICNDKILLCANKADKDGITEPIKIEDNEEMDSIVNEMMELARKKEDDSKKKKTTRRKKVNEDSLIDETTETEIEETPKKKTSKPRKTSTKTATTKKAGGKKKKVEEETEELDE